MRDFAVYKLHFVASAASKKQLNDRLTEFSIKYVGTLTVVEE